MTVFEKYLDLLSKKKDLDSEILSTQVEIYNLFKNELDKMETGTFNEKRDGFNIKIIKKETTSVDNEMAEILGFGFRAKYSLDKKAYKKLTDEQKQAVDGCITTKPAKPSFTIERE